MSRQSRSGSVTVVVPALNAEGTIEAQLQALASQTYSGTWRVLISDNGSDDRTIEIARSWSSRLPGLQIVDASQRRGVAHARNVATAVADELVAFCDADDVVAPEWLEALVREAAEVDIVGGSLEHDSLNSWAMSGWRGGSTTELQTTYGFLPYAVGGNCLIRRVVWEALGGWDLSFERGEDVDFCWRAQLAGYTIGFAPLAVSHLRHRENLGGVARQVYDYARAEVGLYRKYKEVGARRRRARQVAADYFYLATRLPYLVLSRRRRGFWVVTAAEALGRLAGSLQHRSFAP